MTEAAKLTYHFDWDPAKAKSNLVDHKKEIEIIETVK